MGGCCLSFASLSAYIVVTTNSDMSRGIHRYSVYARSMKKKKKSGCGANQKDGGGGLAWRGSGGFVVWGESEGGGRKYVWCVEGRPEVEELVSVFQNVFFSTPERRSGDF